MEITLGYINEEMKHACISVNNPVLNNCYCNKKFSQVVYTIDELKELRIKINLFLAQHKKPDA